MHVFVTGAAGFIGFHLSRALLEAGHTVTGIDTLDDYYSVQLKKDRVAQLKCEPNFVFSRTDMADATALEEVFVASSSEYVVHLAAQAGVRYSLKNPQAYVRNNLVAFANLLECCRKHPVSHLVFASSSSVYGLNRAQPSTVHAGADHPVSLYAATKRSNELLAHSYSHLYGIPCTGLRFFTVYGPWGRPDMALHMFASAIVEGRPINVFNNGKMSRDFTYVGDIVEGVVRLINMPPERNEDWDRMAADPATSSAPWRLANIGDDCPVELAHFIEVLEKVMGRKAVKNFLPMQPGDVQATWADISDMERLVGFRPKTSLEEGITSFWHWFRDYYKVPFQGKG